MKPGEPLIGVSVQAKGTSNGTITDMDGKYTLRTDEGKTIVFSYVGYKRMEQKAGSQMKVQMGQWRRIAERSRSGRLWHHEEKRSDRIGCRCQVKRL